MKNGHKAVIDVDDIPFDQYSRQLIVKNIVEDAIRPLHNNALKILDIGGYKGRTAEFFSNDNVTILDVFNVKEKNYIKGDATGMTFSDGEFDLASSFDVLEHIPRPKRAAFIKESSRVSRLGFFIAAPINDSHNTVTKAEQAADDIFKKINNKQHRWLKEHIEYGIPTQSEIEKEFTKNKLHYTKTQSNEIITWFALQGTFFIKSILEKNKSAYSFDALSAFYSLHKKINATYNREYKNLEIHDDTTAYRTVYFASRDKKLVDSVEDYINKTAKATVENRQSTKQSQMLLYTEMFDALAEVVNLIDKDHSKVVKQNQKLHEDNELLRQQLVDIQNSRSWKITRPLRAANKKVKE